MEDTVITRLDLRSPLLFDKIAEIPTEIRVNEEILLLFELDPAQSLSIEPISDSLLGSFVFAGIKTAGSQGDIALPAGVYIFTQRRDAVKTDSVSVPEWLELAIEQQKDALWERNKIESRLYVRFLFEDGGLVTQLFRPSC